MVSTKLTAKAAVVIYVRQEACARMPQRDQSSVQLDSTLILLEVLAATLVRSATIKYWQELLCVIAALQVQFALHQHPVQLPVLRVPFNRFKHKQRVFHVLRVLTRLALEQSHARPVQRVPSV